jgi:TPR repeat protein
MDFHQANKQAWQCYREGKRDETLRILKEGAEAGDLESLYGLGVCYENGIGLQTSIEYLAFQCYQEAANRGSNEAMAGVARLYQAGKGVGRSDPLAVLYYGKALEHGLTSAADPLGRYYRDEFKHCYRPPLATFFMASKGATC